MPRVAANTTTQVKMETDGSATNGDAKNDWLAKKKTGQIKKLPKDVLKRRRNSRLGRLLNPKPPMMVLMELTKQGEVTFEKYISDPMSRLLKCTAQYDGTTFEGVGPTKNIAKNICSEAILQYIAFKACEKDQAEAASATKGPHSEEETPWTALASVALFKMFNDWQAQGAVIPPELMKCVPRAANNLGQAGLIEDIKMEDATEKKPAKPKPAKTKEAKQLPADAATRHPVQMLHEMVGACNYETVSDGSPPDVVYHMSVIINEQKFTGSAKNKKDAKKRCAMEVMRNVYGVVYPE
jgi:hypothetical protein